MAKFPDSTARIGWRTASRRSKDARMNQRNAWAAVVRRDPEADEKFVFAVETTGIYCRASCPAKRPHRENVRFFATPAEAERAGFRVCKRCGGPRDALVARARE